VLRSRIQSTANMSLVECVRETYKLEGWRGFYRGMMPTVVKVTPTACLLFLTFETVSNMLGGVEHR
jgi:solute carrier family 25 folate transporter 32